MKKLNVRQPIIRCYPHHANLTGTITINEFDFDELSPHYLQLIYNKDNNRIDFNYGMDILGFIKNYPYVDSYCYDRKIVETRYKSYSEFIENMINNECFVSFLVDAYYISVYEKWYMTYHHLHDIMVYGYDENYFYVGDCFVNGVYTYEKIEKNEIDNAVLEKDEYDWLDGIHCWRPKEDMYLGIGIDSMFVKKMINQYLKHKRSTALTLIEDRRRNKYGYQFIYGIDIYKELIKYVSNTSDYLDERFPYIIVEHKKILKYVCRKLKYQYKLNYSDENLKQIEVLEEQSIILQNLFLIFNISNSNNKKIKDRIIKQIYNLEKEETNILNKIYFDIRIKTSFIKPKILNNINIYEYKKDEMTSGNWKGVYGSKGYYIVGDVIRMPSEIELYTNNCIYVSVFRNNADYRALCRADNDNHLLAYYLHDKEFNIEIQNKIKRKIALYFVDYDLLNRIEGLCVQSKNPGSILFEYTLDSFSNGCYISFDIYEDIIISVKSIKGPNAVISGIFFD